MLKKHEFSLQPGQEYIQLNRFLKAVDMVDSGGEARIRILNKEVEVNGDVETRIRNKLRPGYIVQIFGKTFQIMEGPKPIAKAEPVVIEKKPIKEEVHVSTDLATQEEQVVQKILVVHEEE